MEERLSRAGEHDQGFTVIEFAIAVSLLVVCLLAASQMLISGMNVSGDTRARIVATHLATKTLEDLRAIASDPTTFTQMPVGQAALVGQKVGGDTFIVTRNVQWVGQRATASNCDAGGGGTQILRATAVVTWANMHGTAPVQSTTTFAPPVGAYSSSSGSIAAHVVDASNAPVPFVTATVSGGPTTSPAIITGADGCAFFPFLLPGTYTVTLSAPGYVGGQEVANPTATPTVVAGTINGFDMPYDKQGSLSVTGYSGGYTPATGLKVSLGNLNLTASSQVTYTPPNTFPGAAWAISPLFPYAAGYTVFAGSCTDSNPNGKDTNRNYFYPSANISPILVPANGSASTTVPLYPLAIKTTNSTGSTALGPATMTLTSTAPTSSGACPSGTPTYNLVSSSSTATGATSTTGVPLGHYQITATTGSGQNAKTGTLKVWVRPDGVWAVDAAGNATTLFAGPVTVKQS